MACLERPRRAFSLFVRPGSSHQRRDRQVPSDISKLLELEPLPLPAPGPHPAFHALLRTLAAFIADLDGPRCLPLAGALPDVHTDTASYVRLQGLYKQQAAAEKVRTVSNSPP